MKKFYILFFAFFIALTAISQPVRYVSETGSGSLDGSSWADAYPADSLQLAIDELSAIGGGEVWVKAGTYYPTVHYDGNTSDPRKKSFSIKSDVFVYGGFAGNETDVAQRTDYGESGANETIFSGDIGVMGDNTDNSYHVVYNDISVTNSGIDGISVLGGNANGTADFEDDDGGGIYSRGEFIIENCLIKENESDENGAGLFLGAKSVCKNSVIHNNIASEDGGGAYLLHFNFSSDPEPLIENCLIYDNYADYGGGVYGKSGGIVLNSRVIANQARYGSGIYLADAGRADNCLISHNEANFYGGGIYLYYGGEATGNTIVSNDANSGAGVYRRYGTGIVQNSVLWNNSGEEFFYYGSDTGIEFCAVQDGYTGSGAGAGIIPLSSQNSGTGTENYPEFRNPNTYQGYNASMIQDFLNADWSLSCASACIDTANAALVPTEITQDIVGNNRIIDGNADGTDKPDMGAFEYTSAYVASASICEGDFLSFGGENLTESGTYIDTLPDTFGCDSIVSLNLTVIPVDSLIINESICEGGVFSYNGIDYTENGTFYQTSPAPSGCDSVIEITINVNLIDTTILSTETIYGSQVIDFYGQDVSSAGTYYYTLQNVFGCDSVIEQSFTHLPVDTVLSEAICEGDFYDFNGDIITVQGTYYDELTSVESGDSVVQLDLTVNLIDTTLLEPVYLGGSQTYDFEGNMINAPGTYYHTLTSIEGCDSVLKLDVFPRKYVRQNGSGSQNGNDWGNAYPDYKLQDAINEISIYGAGQVWVAKGTYKPTTGSSRGLSFVLYDSVQLYGGFNGFEDSISERTGYGLYQGNETRLSGDINTPVDTSDNSYIVIRQSSEHYCLIDGFTIRDACHPGTLAEVGGVHLKAGGILRNSVIINNYAEYKGGGVYNEGGTIENCIIRENRTDGYAGGVLLAAGSIVNSEIIGNITDNGGAGLLVEFDNSLIENCVFADNYTYEYGWGGAISMENNADTILISNSTFSNNQSILGGAIYQPNNVNALEIDNCVFTNNEAIDYFAEATSTTYAGKAGAIFLTSGLVKNSVFDGNQATVGGALGLFNNAISESNVFINNYAADSAGAVYIYQSGILKNSTIKNNTADFGAGVLITGGGDITDCLIEGNLAYDDGGGIFTRNGGTITNCEIVANNADAGAGMFLKVGGTVNNCKVAGNEARYYGGGIYNEQNQDPILNSYIYNNSVHYYDGGGVYNDASNSLTCEVYNSIIYNNQVGRNGAGVYFYFGGKLINSNILKNHADDDGGGTYIREKGQVLNSVIWGNNTQIFTNGTNTQLIIDTTAVQDGYTGTGAGDFILDIDTLNDGSLSANYAKFVAPTSFVGAATNAADSLALESANWNLNCGSALIDQGSNNLLHDSISTDILANNRFFDGSGDGNATVDFGAIEANYNYYLEIMLCEGDVFTLGSQSITEAGIYTDNLSSVDACDSIVTAEVFIVPIDTVQVDEYVCEGTIYDFNGQLISSPGNYTETFVSSFGCDSVVELSLFHLPVDTTNLSESICQGSTYDFFGTELDVPGNYEHILPNQSGCDSIIILNLDVNPVYEFIEDHSICDGEVYSWQGADYSAAGTYYSNHQTEHGCDSVYVLNLDVNPVYEFVEDHSICDGEIYSWQGADYSTAGTYYSNHQTEHGCDSVYVLNLDVNPVYEFIEDHSICDGEVYSWQGADYSTAGTYYSNHQTEHGCDSVYVLNLDVNPVYEFIEDHSICDGEVYSWQGADYSTAGTYYSNHQTEHGCDSVYVLNLDVNPVYEFIEDHSICDGEVYSWQGADYSAAGTYYSNHQTEHGCDSVYVLNLDVNPVYEFVEDHSICDGEIYSWQGADYSTAGTYYSNHQTEHGCDSVYVLNLDVNPVYEFIEDHSICDGEVYSWQGADYSTAGTYYSNHQTEHGCDSVYVLNLDVNPVYEFIEDHSICDGEVYSWQGADYSTAGTYYSNHQTEHGCDSVYVLNLDVNPLPETPVISINDEMLISDTEQGNQWYHDYNAIDDANSDYYVPEENGEYYVIVTGNNGCVSDTSNIILVNWVSVDLQENLQIAVYPNPFKSMLYVEADNGEFVHYELFNVLGKKIDSGEFMHKTAISTTNLKPSSYLLRLTVGETVKTIKVIKQ